jgi:hypothetical protein
MDVEIKIRLPEALVKEAQALGILSNEHIEMIIRAEIQAHLTTMANDTQIQDELRQIASELSITESDGLPTV